MNTDKAGRKKKHFLGLFGLKRSANDQIVLGEPSTINSRTWWTSGYHKVQKNFPRASVEYDFGTCENLAVFAATMRGAKHQFHESQNQDSFSVCSVEGPNKHIVIAVCDGVSGSKYSAYGSRRLARESVSRLAKYVQVSASTSHVNEEAFRKVLMESSVAMQTWSSTDPDCPPTPPRETPAVELSTTIALVLINTQQNLNGDYPVQAAIVGDSPIYLSVDDHYEIKSSYTKGGDVVQNSTDALPVTDNEQIAMTWVEMSLAPSSHILITTDGFSNVLREGNTKHAKILNFIWSTPASPANMLSHLVGVDFDRRGEDDDRTAVIVWSPPFKQVLDTIETDEQTTLATPNITSDKT